MHVDGRWKNRQVREVGRVVLEEVKWSVTISGGVGGAEGGGGTLICLVGSGSGTAYLKQELGNRNLNRQ